MQKSIFNLEDSSKSLATRVMDALDGGVEADAWCKREAYHVRKYWFSTDVYFNDCALNDYTFLVSAVLGTLKLTNALWRWSWASVSVLIASTGAHIALAKFYNSKCGYRGAILNIHVYGALAAKSICKFW